jgi:Cu-processing system ATP-binding protein
LDPLSSEILKQKIIDEKQKGKLVLITSHILSELDDLVTDVIYMQEGKLNFKKSLITLKQETGEQRLSKAVARVMTTLNQ